MCKIVYFLIIRTIICGITFFIYIYIYMFIYNILFSILRTQAQIHKNNKDSYICLHSYIVSNNITHNIARICQLVFILFLYITMISFSIWSFILIAFYLINNFTSFSLFQKKNQLTSRVYGDKKSCSNVVSMLEIFKIWSLRGTQLSLLL